MVLVVVVVVVAVVVVEVIVAVVVVVAVVVIAVAMMVIVVGIFSCSIYFYDEIFFLLEDGDGEELSAAEIQRLTSSRNNAPKILIGMYVCMYLHTCCLAFVT